jgi:hypothetical protein
MYVVYMGNRVSLYWCIVFPFHGLGPVHLWDGDHSPVSCATRAKIFWLGSQQLLNFQCSPL